MDENLKEETETVDQKQVLENLDKIFQRLEKIEKLRNDLSDLFDRLDAEIAKPK